MAVVKKFPDTPEAKARLARKEAQLIEKNKSDAENGARAWEAVLKWRKDRPKRLESNDREAIARNWAAAGFVDTPLSF